jgi:hypothetical protein
LRKGPPLGKGWTRRRRRKEEEEEEEEEEDSTAIKVNAMYEMEERRKGGWRGKKGPFRREGDWRSPPSGRENLRARRMGDPEKGMKKRTETGRVSAGGRAGRRAPAERGEGSGWERERVPTPFDVIAWGSGLRVLLV